MGVRDQCLKELALGTMQLHRVRLLVCGTSGVGKSALVTSLKSGFLQGLLRYSTSSTHSHLPHTYGFSVHQTTIPGSGQFSIWDFSGQQEYYPVHEFFLDSRNTIYILVYSLLHPLDKQLDQLRFWLAMIKSKQRPEEVIHYAGHTGRRPYVILVASFSDQPNHVLSLAASNNGLNNQDDFDVMDTPILNRAHSSASLLLQPSSIRCKKVLQHMVEEFGHYFAFTDRVFALDCRSSRSREIRVLRSLLATLRESMLKVWLILLYGSLTIHNTYYNIDHITMHVYTYISTL